MSFFYIFFLFHSFSLLKKKRNVKNANKIPGDVKIDKIGLLALFRNPWWIKGRYGRRSMQKAKTCGSFRYLYLTRFVILL